MLLEQNNDIKVWKGLGADDKTIEKKKNLPSS